MVLVVEDDRDTRELYRTALTAAGYAVVAVEDGFDALRILEQTRPAAVVLDLGLPRLRGLDVAREMAAHSGLQQVPIVVVTGDPGDVNEKEFACVLRKPINPDRLISAVIDCLHSLG